MFIFGIGMVVVIVVVDDVGMDDDVFVVGVADPDAFDCCLSKFSSDFVTIKFDSNIFGGNAVV